MNFMMRLFLLVSTLGVWAILFFLGLRAQPEDRLCFIHLGRPRNESDRAMAKGLGIFASVGLALTTAIALFAEDGRYVGGAIGAASLLATVVFLFGVLYAVKSGVREQIPQKFAVLLDEEPSVFNYLLVPLEVLHVGMIVTLGALLLWVGEMSLPMQYSGDGQVVRVGAAREFWLLFGIIVFDAILMWFIAFATSREKMAVSPDRPHYHRSLIHERRRALIRLVQWLIVLVNASMAVTVFGLIASALGWVRIGGTQAVLTGVLATIATVVPLIVYLPRLMKVSAQLRKVAGSEALGTHPNAWRWGGTIYYAPDDPAVFVPKRIGIGSTVNFARPSAWIFLAVIILGPLALMFIFR